MNGVDPDELALLEDERDHLLASLDDLEAEYAAGDLDETDYRLLRDDYTARAAATIRAVESGEERRRDEKPSRSWARIVVWSVGVGVVSVVAGVLIAQASGSRGATGVGSGEIRQTSRVLLFEAGDAAAAGDLDTAIDRYSEVIEIEPANVEAFTYRGWSQWQRGDAAAAADDLAEAVAIDPDYPDARVFSAVVALNAGPVDEAAGHLVHFAGLETPALMRDLVANGRVRERTAERFGDEGRAADALAFLDELIAEDPDDAALLAYRGWILARTAVDAPELAAGAEQYLRDAEAAAPTFPDTYVYLAFLYNFLDRQDEARDALGHYDDLVADDPDGPPAHLEELIEAQDLRAALTP